MTQSNENNEEKGVGFGQGLKAISPFMKPFKGKLILLAFLGIVSAVANGSVPYVTGRFFDALIGISSVGSGVTDSWSLWATLLLVWAIVQIIANNIDWVSDRLRRKVSLSVHFDIQTNGFVHLLHLPLSYHKSVHINGVLNILSQAGWRISSILERIADFIPQLLSVLIGITLAASINLLLAGVLLAGVCIYLILLAYILAPIAKIDAMAHHSWHDSWDDAAAAVTQIDSVKQAAAEDFETEKVRRDLKIKTQEYWLKLERNWSNVQFFQRIIVFFTQLTIFIISVRLISSGAISVGGLVALNGYALMFFGPFVALGGSWQVIQNGFTSAVNARKIFDQSQEEYSSSSSIVPERFQGSVRFENVSFNYGPDHPKVLDGVDFEVLPGQSVAFVGESGVGKSTTISLISGYYFPNEGTVSVSGYDTRRFDLFALRKNIGVVPQEVALFNDTIETNIRYGSFSATHEDVMRVSKEAHIDDFVSAMPKGYDTIVGERGVKLSVGQKQRIAIARAMLRDPAILILDEPTSALDAMTEKIVTEALERLMQGRTTFIIAHRLSTVRRADMIFVFEKGKIVERGSHQELIAREGGVYRKLYEHQIGLH